MRRRTFSVIFAVFKTGAPTRRFGGSAKRTASAPLRTGGSVRRTGGAAVLTSVTALTGRRRAAQRSSTPANSQTRAERAASPRPLVITTKARVTRRMTMDTTTTGKMIPGTVPRLVAAPQENIIKLARRVHFCWAREAEKNRSQGLTPPPPPPKMKSLNVYKCFSRLLRLS